MIVPLNPMHVCASAKVFEVVDLLSQWVANSANTLTTFRNNSGWDKYASKYTPASDVVIASHKVGITKFGNPSGNVWIEIRRASDDALLGTSSTVTCASITSWGTFTEFTGEFDPYVELDSGVAVYLALCSDYTYSTTNYLRAYNIGGDSTLFSPDGYRYQVGTGWLTATTYNTLSSITRGYEP